MKTILTLTLNPAVDLDASIDQVLPNRKLRCSSAIYLSGGGGINVSRAIHNLGGESTAMFVAGGPRGQLLTSLLQHESIAVRCIQVDADTRENVNVFERDSGNHYRFVMPGSELRPRDWQHLLAAIRVMSPRPDYLVASGSLPPGVPEDFYGRLARIAADLGFRLIVDTSGLPLRHAATPGTFLLKPNVSEFGALAGGAPFGDEFLEGAASAIVAAGRVDAIVISAGAGGAVLVDGSGPRRIPAPTVRIESRVGAGDSMVAGLVLALARGSDLAEATRFGVAAGSAAVMQPGGQLCRREDTERLFAAMKKLDDRSLAVA